MDGKTILVTGFEPFGGERVNPSLEAVSRLNDFIGPCRVVRASLPVVFHSAGEQLIKLLDEIRPDIALCTGQAGGAAGIRVERVALNLQDASIPDNAGCCPQDEEVVSGGPAAYFSTLPVRRILTRLRSEGIAADISLSAGTYVCNSVMYTLMHHLKSRGGIGGFIHVPFLPEQAAAHPGKTGMALSMMTRALALSLEVTAEYLTSDPSAPGG